MTTQTGARYAPHLIANKLATLTNDARRITRKIDGYTRTLAHLPGGRTVTRTVWPASGNRAERLWAMRDDLDAQIAYWQGIRDAQTAERTTPSE